MAADETYPSGVHRRQDGSLRVPSGATLDIESGGTLSFAGVNVNATAAEINNVADVSARLVAAGASLTLTVAAHSGKLIALDTAAGSAITLPAATGSGAVFDFLVTVKPTSNQHRISVVGNDAFYGSVNILDADAAAQNSFAAGSDADQFNLNGTTTGGQKGDWVRMVDMVADGWHVVAQLVCPSGSDDATPFATGQVT
ncbi:MAG: hypothetical protein B6D36_05530 [Planctomycetes bacterium UTPLA1]|jgi:hypothetical protein|nr:MAG: hypothetical protein B6D36_05530 [Planctomycetes bacterium UTPLA1]